MMPRTRQEWLTTDEACAYLSCTRKALYHHIARGHITAARLGRQFRFSRASLDSCLHDSVRMTPVVHPWAHQRRSA